MRNGNEIKTNESKYSYIYIYIYISQGNQQSNKASNDNKHKM